LPPFERLRVDTYQQGGSLYSKFGGAHQRKQLDDSHGRRIEVLPRRPLRLQRVSAVAKGVRQLLTAAEQEQQWL
jgi:hypothetical protein